MEESLGRWIGKNDDIESLLQLLSLLHNDDVQLKCWLWLDYKGDNMMNVVKLSWLFRFWDIN